MAEFRTVALALPPTAAAAAAGRRFVAAVLSIWGIAHLEYRAVLLTSELISNAVLHARTPLTLSVTDLPGGAVRVSVADASPLLPQQRHAAAADAGTGRGLALLDGLAGSWSADRTGCGKQVSFSVGAREAAGGEPPAAAAGESDDGQPLSALGRYSPADAGPQTAVRLLGLPVALYAASRQHHDDLIQEFAVLAVARPELVEALPVELAHLVDVLGYRYGTPNRRVDDPVDAARAAGRRTVDLEFVVSVHAAVAAGRLEELLVEADELARAGRLLSLPRSAGLVAFSGWYTGEICRQLAGEPARPWVAATDC